LTDVVYTHYLKSVEKGHVIRASSWAAVVTFIGGVIFIEYTQNKLMIIPAVLGAFFGTIVGMKMKKNKQD